MGNPYMSLSDTNNENLNEDNPYLLDKQVSNRSLSSNAKSSPVCMLNDIVCNATLLAPTKTVLQN